MKVKTAFRKAKTAGIRVWSKFRVPEKPVKAVFVRHGVADYNLPGEPLTPQGAQGTFTAGTEQKSLRGYKIKRHHSDMLRTEQTSEEFTAGAQKAGATAYPNARERPNMGIKNLQKDTAGHNALYKKIGPLAFFRGMIEKDPAVTAVSWPLEKITDQVLYETRLGKKLDEKGATGIVIGKFSHGGYPEYILYRLTGLRFDRDTVPANTPTRNNETLELEFRRGQVILNYRNVRKNVTRRYNQIISRMNKERQKKWKRKKS